MSISIDSSAGVKVEADPLALKLTGGTMTGQIVTAATGIKFNDASTLTSAPNTTGLAPLASPAFTGTPTALTAAVGTNTTQLATTAFVTAATALQAPLSGATFTGLITVSASGIQFSDGSTITSAFTPKQTSYQGLSAFPGVGTVSGTGTASGGSTGINLKTGGTAGVICRYTSTGSNAPMSLGKNKGVIDWSKKARMASSFVLYTPTTVEPTATTRCTFGKNDTEVTGAVDFSSATKGIGWKIIGTGQLQLLVGNGTTAQSLPTGYTLTPNQTVYIEIKSDGLGVATVYVNSTLIYTSPAGSAPSSAGISTANQTAIEFQVTAATAIDTQAIFGEVTTQIDM